ncbi:MAG: triose-phosphate isomerase, partial [Bacteroidales bacterium]|nr:triose-phosphate isomerase [Candidatus Colimorpha onthohippi]
MRKHIVAGNWKMNKSFEEADELIGTIQDKLEDITLDRDMRLVICPPAPYLEMCGDGAEESYFMVGAQDVSTHDNGAYTGEISASMLESMEISYCIVGHSERRAYHNETDSQIADKVNQLIAHNIIPIVCCGEVLSERESGTQFEVVKRQITCGLFHLTADEIQNIVIAYEPVWAIGTGKTATPQQAQEMHAYIRGVLASQYGQAVADEISILYGGSCKPGNARELFANPDVDGGLIGGAS